VVNSSAAQRFWPGEDPLGKQISFDDTRMLTIVGIIGAVRQRSLGVAPQPEIFLDYLQPGPDWPWLVLVVKTESEPAKLAGTLKAVAQSVDRDVPVLEVRTMDEVLSSSLAEAGVYALLLSLFASVALALAAVGLYGIVLVFRFSLCRHFIRSAVLPADSLEPRDGLGTSRPGIQ